MNNGQLGWWAWSHGISSFEIVTSPQLCWNMLSSTIFFTMAWIRWNKKKRWQGQGCYIVDIFEIDI